MPAFTQRIFIEIGTLPPLVANGRGQSWEKFLRLKGLTALLLKRQGIAGHGGQAKCFYSTGSFDFMREAFKTAGC
jgi:hypothetical protein